MTSPKPTQYTKYDKCAVKKYKKSKHIKDTKVCQFVMICLRCLRALSNPDCRAGASITSGSFSSVEAGVEANFATTCSWRPLTSAT